VRGQSAAVEQLQAALKAGRLAHAYLFTGPEGVGKRTLARELAKAVLCQQRGADGCDRCPSCRAVASGNSPDFATPVVEDAGGKVRLLEDSDRQIKIASIRALESDLRLKSASGRTRAYLIPGAERMNEEAANALLKTLEEPAGSRLLILTSARPEALLPTVLSRVARVRLRRLAEREVADYLVAERKLSRAEAGELAAASGGSIGAALAASLESVRAAEQLVGGSLARLPVPPPLALTGAMMAFARAARGSEAGRDRELEPLRRGLLALWAQALARYRRALAGALGAPGGEAAATELAALGPERLARALEALLRADRAVRDYAAPELVCRVLAGELAALAGRTG